MDISIEKELLTFNIDRVLKKEMYFNIFVSISNKALWYNKKIKFMFLIEYVCGLWYINYINIKEILFLGDIKFEHKDFKSYAISCGRFYICFL